jgi:hypothetical protein
MGSRLFHQEVEEIANDHTKKSLERTGNEGGIELEEEEVNESIDRSDIALLHINLWLIPREISTTLFGDVEAGLINRIFMERPF